MSISISLCMIVKNEENCIGNCLENIHNAVDEIIICDTGSSDATISICKKFTDKFFSIGWNNDFSKARNFGLNKAIGNWILVLDADEIIELPTKKEIHAFLENTSKEIGGYYLSRINFTEKDDVISEWPDTVLRLFRNDTRIYYERTVHEFVNNTIKTAGFTTAKCNYQIKHYGFLKNKNYLLKSRKYLELLINLFKKNPRDFHNCIIIASEYEKQRDYDNEEIYLLKAYELKKNNPEMLARLGVFYAARKQDYTKALFFFLDAETNMNKQSNLYNADIEFATDLFTHLSKIYLLNNDYKNALQYFNKSFKLSTKNNYELLRLGITIYEKIGNYSKTIYLAQKIFGLKNSANALADLIARYLKINNIEKAKILSEQFKEIFPDKIDDYKKILNITER